MRKLVVILVLVTSSIGLIGYLRAAHLADEKAELDTLTIAEAVEELPPGVEAAWAALIDSRLRDRIKKSGSALEIEQPRSVWSRSVSLTMPFDVECRGVANIAINFGFGDDSIIVLITNRDDLTSGPELGVNPYSVAAKRLNKTLCRQTADYVGELQAGGGKRPRALAQQN